MQLIKLIALTLATAVSDVAAYKILGNNVNCRSGPGTQHGVVRSYNKGHDVQLTCQTHGENIFGLTLWDKTTNNCFVSDYYVETGTPNMVVKECNSDSGGGGSSSSYQGRISRSEIISRGRYWTSRHVPYSQQRTYPDAQGRRYRTDCSGFVSMALHASAPGYNTVSLTSIARSISSSDLKPGDFVGTLGAGTGGDAGHVVLFLSWVGGSRSRYDALECNGSQGCVQSRFSVGWGVGGRTAKPYRYTRVID
ncbi:hypothetical protein QBC35DRAFT_46663 [Podospora australis]|uniref:NlpC/P60 domain-containing protein n=1 Tax=Podospora australis TaxID=1536484 RepID=A0AAN6WML4_9PEZI|nr:hypothetical protein QBC35DRAFT_46663 [Podospora australis]